MKTRKIFVVCVMVAVAGLFIIPAAWGTPDNDLIQGMIDALPPGGGTVTLEARTYNIDHAIIMHDNITLQGAGMDQTIIYMTSANAPDIQKNAY